MNKIIRSCDFVVDIYPRSKPKGMRVDGMDKGVIVLHKPTGLEFYSESERSQHRNKDAAFKQMFIYLEGLGWAYE